MYTYGGTSRPDILQLWRDWFLYDFPYDRAGLMTTREQFYHSRIHARTSQHATVNIQEDESMSVQHETQVSNEYVHFEHTVAVGLTGLQQTC